MRNIFRLYKVLVLISSLNFKFQIKVRGQPGNNSFACCGIREEWIEIDIKCNIKFTLRFLMCTLYENFKCYIS